MSGSDDSVSTPLWKRVPLCDYHVPTPPAEKVAASLWSSIHQKFRRRDAIGIELKEEQELHCNGLIYLVDGKVIRRGRNALSRLAGFDSSYLEQEPLLAPSREAFPPRAIISVKQGSSATGGIIK